MSQLINIKDLLPKRFEVRSSDFFRIKKEIQKLVKFGHDEAKIKDLENRIEKAKSVYQLRNQLLPKDFDYPDILPVFEKKNDIAELIKKNQVVIIAGETGSGKTTQIPKICLELGRGVKGFIGHTQPRRLAARSVANRIAEELKSEVGEIVGYKVRFNDQVKETTLIKLMTDGILLTEIQQDRFLSQYDTIIIDEAHERSLNIDFILGYLKQLLPKRPDLKIIVTSATIDVERFSHHFNNAPIVEVSGRTYPVEVRYRPINEESNINNDEQGDFQEIINAIDELSHEDNRGDILIFLTGEKEIRDLGETLNKLNLLHTEIVPLFARLSTSEQNRIFQKHNGRRIILSTNVAETSLTVPGIKYVIDPGMARISRYSYRTKVQRLPIEPISQASANQRRGRCGRTSNGICIRLYDEQDFLSRSEFSDPEILRTNLASVILQMTALDLGDISAFPFLEPPEKKHIKDGIRLLEELGAIHTQNHHYKLTKIGKILAQIPIDPKFARMLIEAKKYSCVKEVMVIVSALSIQDPRERPLEKQQASDEKHSRFADKNSDFVTYLNLWNYINEQQKILSSNQFKQMCRKEFLNYLRVKEWQDVYTQVRQTIKQLSIPINEVKSDYQSLHISILSGLLSNVGMKEIEKSEYIGARNVKFSIFPASSVFKTLPKWSVASELVETSKLWARQVAKIEPQWIEPIAEHLIKKHYSEPRWSKNQGTTIAYEKVTLFGLPIINQRIVNYHKINPVLSREILIKQALIAGDCNRKYDFLLNNQKLMNEVEILEHKSRRRDILIEESILFDFYDQKIPLNIACLTDLDTWWKEQKNRDDSWLNLTEDQIINPNSGKILKEDYPDFWHYNDQIHLKLTYQFDIGNNRDGVTINIPLSILNQIENDVPFQWQVNGFRQDLIVSLIKSLPKSLRRNLVPAPNYAEAFLARVDPYQNELLLQLENEFRKMTGITIKRDDWNQELIPDYLIMTYAILDEKGKVLLLGKNLNELKEQLKDKMQKALTQMTKKQNNDIEKTQVVTWNFGLLPKIYEKKEQNYTVKAYPTLIDEGTSVSIKLVDNEQEQEQSLKIGIRRLLYLNIPSPIKYLHEKLPNKAKLGLYFNPFGKIQDLIDDCIFCGIDYLIEKEQGAIFDEKQFNLLLSSVKVQINDLIFIIAQQVEKILTLNYEINRKLKAKMNFSVALSLADIKQQLSNLIYKGFVTDCCYEKLTDIYRYLQAMDKRLEKLYSDPNKDRLQLIIIDRVSQHYQELKQNSQFIKNYHNQKLLIKLRWMIEELRVNLFAQQIGTPYPISEKRIIQFINEIS